MTPVFPGGPALPMWGAPGPLADLAGKLQPAPPSLSYLIELFDETESLGEFVRVVQEFLPDQYAEIMAQDMDGRMMTFVRHFERRYFPIDETAYLDEGYWPLVASIPVPRMGIDWDDYHELEEYHPGLRLLFAVVATPYHEFGGDGARVPLLEHVATIVGADLVGRIPPEGWRPEELHARLDNTEFQGMALAADWLWRQTNTIFLDATYEDDLSELRWDRETVAWLTEEWPRAEAMRDEIANLHVWLEADSRERFGAEPDLG